MKLHAIGLLAAILIPSLASAQANVVPGRDIKLHAMQSITALGRFGTFPNGTNGLAMATTSCNVGTVTIPWQQVMDPDHPLIAFLLARQTGTTFEQISDYSYLKHGFLSLNSPGCGTCQNPGTGALLGIGCSDTYSVSNNGDNFWLGPSWEIDPWLGTWDPICSHFDKGEPAVAPPADCDGVRSLSSAQAIALGSVGHRIRVLDADLNMPGNFYYSATYVTQGEAEALRNDDGGSRRFTATWNGSNWALSTPATSNPLTYGSILDRWAGASVSSTKNGDDDGRVFVAVRVTGPVGGLYHYDYAVHNRDNMRGVGKLRIPICADALVLNEDFHDIDELPGNDWAVSRTATELMFSTDSNPIRWNSFFNFRFDSDAAPVAGSASIDAFTHGGGADQLAISTSVPGALYNVNLGPGCALDVPPALYAAGTPPQATLGNASFALETSGHAASALVVTLWSATQGSQDLGGGCTLWMGGTIGSDLQIFGIGTAGAGGVASFPAAVPNDPAVEGLQLPFQSAGFAGLGSPLFGEFELSNGLLVRVGSALTGCPQ